MVGIDPSIAIMMNGIPVSDEGCMESDDVSSPSSRGSRVRMLRCPWNMRQDLKAFLLGGVTEVAGTPLYVFGQVYPDDPSYLCTKVDLVDAPTKGTPSTGENGMIAWDSALLKCQYQIPEWRFQSPTATGEVEANFGTYVVATDPHIPSAKWFSDGAPLPPGLSPGIKLSTVDFSITRYRQPVLPFDLICDTLDNVNIAPFQGRPAGTVLYIGARTQRLIQTTGKPAWNTTHSFKFRTKQWNSLFRAGPGVGTGSWQDYQLMDGSFQFTPSDLDALLA